MSGSGFADLLEGFCSRRKKTSKSPSCNPKPRTEGELPHMYVPWYTHIYIYMYKYPYVIYMNVKASVRAYIYIYMVHPPPEIFTSFGVNPVNAGPDPLSPLTYQFKRLLYIYVYCMSAELNNTTDARVHACTCV